MLVDAGIDSRDPHGREAFVRGAKRPKIYQTGPAAPLLPGALSSQF